ncbi:hypothetical protein A5784_12290 [Mycobacterium sp. 852013-50091_SCH5140682]|uniref:LysR family transcriptional regulator n=1 Tax=Mycobacterium sp. 852013-50091_SCH5140682 TaxID=1834109 RepID=UPI0007EB9447|nr:LysR family transcriptional regulator [Mycobacterium sp. 852013-50091_SCH5140682]OBC04737.1 hypothetical protein A5784_12290 [Mycobacterium sp. 852013-50091_SCH5140682]
MTLRQFQYFVAIVDEGSFTRAAHRLYVAQPSLSKQLSALEREVGAPLIERLPRGIRLTAAGRAFLPEARAAIHSEERARRAARMARDLTSAEIEVATVMSIAVGILPGTIQLLSNAHPGVTVKLHEYRHSALMEDEVRGGVADLAIGPAPKQWDGLIETLGWEELVLVLPAGDPLLGCADPVDLRRLADRRWVLPDETAGLAGLVISACESCGFVPSAIVRSAQVEALERLAAAGLGPTMLPSNVVSPEFRPLMRRVRQPVSRELAVYTRSDWAPGGDALRSALRTSCGLPSDPPSRASIA